MKKRIIVLLVVLLLLASTIQVAFAKPPGPVPASCHMVASWGDPGAGDTGPGNANGVEPGKRGMYRVHNNENHPRGYTYGAQHIDITVRDVRLLEWATSAGKTRRIHLGEINLLSERYGTTVGLSGVLRNLSQT